MLYQRRRSDQDPTELFMGLQEQQQRQKDNDHSCSSTFSTDLVPEIKNPYTPRVLKKSVRFDLADNQECAISEFDQQQQGEEGPQEDRESQWYTPDEYAQFRSQYVTATKQMSKSNHPSALEYRTLLSSLYQQVSDKSSPVDCDPDLVHSLCEWNRIHIIQDYCGLDLDEVRRARAPTREALLDTVFDLQDDICCPAGDERLREACCALTQTSQTWAAILAQAQAQANTDCL